MTPFPNAHVPRKGRFCPHAMVLTIGASLTLLAGACDSGEASSEDESKTPAMGEESVEISPADRSCESDDDCALVYSHCLGCDRAAIARDAVGQYRSELQALCESFRGPYGDCDARSVVARCEQSACVVKEITAVDTSVTTPHEVEVRAAHTACEADSDCTTVETGCNGCCQRAAIRAESVDNYQADKAEQCAGFHDAICDCQPVSLDVFCRSGACVAAAKRE